MTICTKTNVRLYSQAPFGESVVALVALLLFMAAVAGLGVFCCNDRVDAYEIASVAFWREVATRSFGLEVSADSATLVAIKAVVLRVALAAVVYRLFCNDAMIPDPVSVMIGSDTFAFMT